MGTTLAPCHQGVEFHIQTLPRESTDLYTPPPTRGKDKINDTGGGSETHM